jgi:hypothetical protein
MTMRLNIREYPKVESSTPYRLSHEGYSGGAKVKTFVIKNNSQQHFYNNIEVNILSIAEEQIVEADFFTNNGWSIKLIVKDTSDLPTEEDWAEVFPNTNIFLEDIGALDEDGIYYSDTNTEQYLFVRVFCPGHTDSGQYEHKIALSYNSINIQSS